MRSGTLLVLLCLLAAAAGLLSGAGGASAWFGYPEQNTPICTAPGDQMYAGIVSDGSGGAVITWEDDRGGAYDIYAQRVDGSGAALWTGDGVAVCTASGAQAIPQIVSHDSGATVITWYDSRSGSFDIYAQRVDSGGAAQWTADGAPICAAPGDQKYPGLISLGAGGDIVTWQDGRSDNSDIYAQRVDSSGLVQWTAGGVPVCTASSPQLEPQIVPDGSGGAIIAWCDQRNSSSGGADIYAQRVDSGGAVQWAADGVPVCAWTGDQLSPRIVADGSGGAIITWSDSRSAGDSNIYAQRLDSSGAAQWTAGGIAVCAAAAAQLESQVAPDGSGGAFIAWYDLRRGGGWVVDIYSQRVSSAGAAQWTADGVAVGTASFSFYEPGIVPDGSGGAIVSWSLDRSGSGQDIYAQRLGSGGVVQWAADGVAVCTAPALQERPRMISDGSSGAIVAWCDTRSSGYDIYADRVDSGGRLPDNQRPAVTLASTAAPATSASPIPVTATFGEAVTGFAIDDMVVGNGAADNFTAVSATVYTCNVTPAGEGPVTVDIAAGAALDAAGNGNAAAARLSITYTLPPPAIRYFSATWGKDGDTVLITGTSFAEVTGVAFGETQALSFTVDSPTRITAVAPHGAGGRITVTTPRGTATSDEDYVPPEAPPAGTNWALIGTIAGIGVVLSAVVGWLVVSRRR